MKPIDQYAAPTAPMRALAAPHNPVIAGVQPAILAVDDDPAIRELIASYLGDNELRVITAATGAEMGRALEEQAIDLVVLDLRLPDEDGMQLARQLRDESAIPIIIRIAGLMGGVARSARTVARRTISTPQAHLRDRPPGAP